MRREGRCSREALLKAARELQRSRGANENYTLIYDCLYPKIERFLYRKGVSSFADREDLTQIIFYRIYRRVGTFRGESSLETWVFRIARNAYYEWTKRLRPVDPVPEDFELEDRRGRSPDKDAVTEEWWRRVVRCIQKLPRQQRRCLILKAYGFSLKEIAARLGIAPNTVGVHLKNGRSKLAKGLK